MKQLTFTLLFLGLGLMAPGAFASGFGDKDKTEPNADAPAETDSTWVGWKKGGEGLVNFSFTGFNDNWSGAQGGVNTFTIVNNLNLFGDFKKDKKLWENSLRLLLGFINTADISDWRKGDDVIDFDSKFGYKISKKAYWATLVTFDSQMAVGRNYSVPDSVDAPIISRFASPAVISLGTGVDYKPVEWISLYFSPVTFKGIIISDQNIANLGIHGNAGAFVDGNGNIVPGDKFKPELGAAFKGTARYDIVKDILNWNGNLELYSNFLENKFGKKKPQNIDILFRNAFNAKITKFIGVTAELTWVYDDETDVRVGNYNDANGDPINDAQPIASDAVPDGATTIDDKGTQFKGFFGAGLTVKF